jgi:Na+-translocating ferredoxin:NAD+ oxidoreductase RnfG subunit
MVAKQVAREGFSGEIKLCLNLNEVGNKLYQSDFF